MAEPGTPPPAEIIKPRDEAVPISHGAMTEFQKAAAKRAWDLVRGHLDQGEPDRPSHEGLADLLPVIDTKRINHVILIDGGRGSGKTSLLLSLLHAWNQKARGEKTLTFTDLEKFVDAEGRVIPLGLLDLRLIDNHGSLTVPMASVLGKVADYLEVDAEASPFDVHDGKSEIKQKWRAFLQAVAARELRIDLRAERLDPEAFAEELHSSERKRIDLHGSFRAMMDAMTPAFAAKHAQAQGRSKYPKSEQAQLPVFVIAIDDADMSPGRVQECFELFEIFNHPRLVFLVTGDSDLFMPSLRVHFLATARKELRGLTISEEVVAKTGVDDEAIKLARRFFDKLIPPSHRCKMPALRPSERLIKEVKGLLERLVLREGKLVADYFVSPEISSVLPDRLRELRDFEADNRDIGDGEAPKLVERLCEMVRDRQVGRVRQAVEGLVKFEKRDNEAESRWIFNLALLRGTSVSVHRRTWRHAEGVALRVSDEVDHGAETVGEPVSVPPEVFGLWLLAGVVCDQHERALFGSAGEADDGLGERSFVVSELEIPSGEVFGVPWPLPKWSSHLRHVTFAQRWSKELDQIDRAKFKGDAERVDDLAYRYVRLAWLTHGGREVSPKGDRWQALAREIADSRNQSRDVAWFTEDVLLLATPESGLPATTTKSILDAWKGAMRLVDWGGYMERVDMLRSKRLEVRFPKKHELLKSEIKRRDPRHPWIAELKAAQGMGRSLADLLSTMPSGPGPDWLPKTLAGYLTPDLRESLSGAQRLITAMEQVPLDSPSRVDAQLYEAWVAARPKNHDAAQWNGIWTLSRDVYKIVAGRRSAYNTRRVGLEGLGFWPYHVRIEQSVDNDVAQAIFAIIHDRDVDVRDDRRDGRPPNPQWDAVTLFAEKLGESYTYWPSVAWAARVDLWCLAESWSVGTAKSAAFSVDEDKDRLDLLARCFVAAQVRVFVRRDSIDDVPERWCTIVEEAIVALDGRNDRMERTERYRQWVRALPRFAMPLAGLEPSAANDILEVIEKHPTIDWVWPDALELRRPPGFEKDVLDESQVAQYRIAERLKSR